MFKQKPTTTREILEDNIHIYDALRHHSQEIENLAYDLQENTDKLKSGMEDHRLLFNINEIVQTELYNNEKKVIEIQKILNKKF